MNRLALTHLTFIGEGVQSATVEFTAGMTVIHGPSDTGKSFIAESIDFMLGATKLEEIPEIAKYSQVLLGLILPSGDTITLLRPVGGGRFSLYNSDIRSDPTDASSKKLASKHNADNIDNLSMYLLSQIELAGKRVRRNSRNQTDSLSFRNIAHLCVIDETAMQAKTPPALSGRPTDKTKEISTLKLILQNEDDSDLAPVSDKKDRERLTDAKVEVIDLLLVELQDQVQEVGDLEDLRAQIERLNAGIEQQTSSLAQFTNERSTLIGELNKQDNIANTTQRSSDDARALYSRFQLLLEQYTSDLKRLEMVAEAGTLLGYFNPGRCVFCGADPEHQHLNEDCAEDTTYFAESVRAEQRKTTALRDDLLHALADLDARQSELSQRLIDIAAQIASIRARLRELDEALMPHQGTLNELIRVRSKLEKTLDIYDQIGRLQTLKVELASEEQEEIAEAVAGLSLSVLADLSQGISDRLKAWGVPDAEHVRYDRHEQDIIAGEQRRSAHGKGIRSILHAAFTIALAQYCFDRDLPHPGFVVLDSPLITYRPPERGGPTDPGDVLDASVAAKFYTDIEQNFGGQIVIMENMGPTTGLGEKFGDVPFTKNSGHGRYGYFPYTPTSRTLELTEE